MVQIQPNLTLALKYLAAQGAVVSAEQQAALDHSLPIKRVEAGLKSILLWGKLLATNGKDYLIAEGYNSALYKSGTIVLDAKYYFSQDGVKWLDLVAIDAPTASKAAKCKSVLSGDSSKVYEWEEAAPAAPTPAAEEEAAEPEAPKPLVVQVPELAVLRQRIDSINSSTNVMPVNSVLPDAHNQMVSNRLFSGVPYPDKLESYMHRHSPPGSTTLAQDLRGSWSLQYDPFKQIATCRSLVWPGYTFFFQAHELCWGALYVGDGVRNDDLVFML